MTSLPPPFPLAAALAQAMLDALPGRVCMVDADGVVRHTNRAWRDHALHHGPREGDCLYGADADPTLRASLQALFRGEHLVMSVFMGERPASRQWARARRLAAPGLDAAVLCLDDLSVVDIGDADLLRFRAAMETTEDALYLVDRATMSFIDVNDAACRLRGCSREELLAMGPAAALDTTPEALAPMYDHVIASGEVTEPLALIRRGTGGEPRHIEIRRRALMTASGWVIVSTGRDVTDHKLAERTLERAARQRRLMADFGRLALNPGRLDDLCSRAAAIAAEGLHIELAELSQHAVDGAGHLVLTAAAGFDAQAIGEAMGHRGGGTLSSRVVTSGAPVILTDIEADLEAAGPVLLRHSVRAGMGVPIPGPGGPRGVLAVYSPRDWRFTGEHVDYLSGVANLLATAMDRVEAEGRLTRLSHFDALTGLPNRTLLMDRLARAIAQGDRHDWRVDVMFLNLDRFKAVNDTLGRAMGDALLVQAAQRLKACVRASDTVGRLGGDEFAIVLPKPDDAATVAKRVITALSQPFELGGQPVYVSASIGVGVYPDDGACAEVLLKNANTAMDQAKERGRNTFLFYLPHMNDQAVLRLQMESRLRHALERDEFLLHYQPKVNLGTGEISGFEALLRWQDPARGLVPPLEFISILEDTGLIVPVGEWVLRTVCRQLARWKAQGLPLRPVAINLSARQFEARGLDEVVRHIVAEEGCDPSLLEFELTESMLMADATAAARTLTALKAYGVRLSVDDFGTGYSSLSYLKRFPLDALKIDRSFMQDVTTDSNDASIALAIIRLAHSLRLKVVAEGVETEDQLQFLRSHDCDQMQGFFFSRPLTEADCTRALLEGRRLDPQSMAN